MFDKFSEPSHNDKRQMSDKVMALYTRTVCIFHQLCCENLKSHLFFLSGLPTFNYFKHFSHKLLQKFMSVFHHHDLYEA